MGYQSLRNFNDAPILGLGRRVNKHIVGNHKQKLFGFAGPISSESIVALAYQELVNELTENDGIVPQVPDKTLDSVLALG